ncbi:MAG: hypothetical protein IKQ20_01105 [Bacteroidales bacterium]|nr:hypothetical protein [Bacteroidales bacterium]
MIEYTIKINNGNENIGSNAKSITVKEKVKTAGVKDLSREINLLNKLIPEQVAAAVLDNFCEAAANLMSMGQAVVLKSRGKAAIRLIPDVKLNGRNITLARAQQLDSTITDLTEENAGDLVQRVGVRVRARAVCAPALTELIQSAGVSTQKTNIINVPKILRANDNGTTPSTGGTTPSGENPNDGND